MSEEPQKKDDKPKRRTIREYLKIDREFLIVSIILIVAVVAISFSTQSLFNVSGEGVPIAISDNFFGMIALVTPFAALALTIVYYLLRFLFSTNVKWSRFIVPLIFAVILGFGYGLLADYLTDLLKQSPSPNGTDPNDSVPGSSTPPTGSSPPNPSSPSSSIFEGIQIDRLVSTVLLVLSGGFVIVAIIFVAIDFMRKREEEFHEHISAKEIRWTPRARSSDHRLRVIRAYHKASYTLIDHGAKSERSMTPKEFEADAYKKIALEDESLTDLTDLYEEARFSNHTISSDQSQKAESNLTVISKIVKRRKIPKEEANQDEKSGNSAKAEKASEKAVQKSEEGKTRSKNLAAEETEEENNKDE